MFRNLRLKLQPEKIVVDPGRLSGEWLAEAPYLPITLAQLNRLPDNVKIRIFRNLIPPSLLTKFDIDPITWIGTQGKSGVRIKAEPGTSVIWISVRTTPNESGEFFCLEIADNVYNGIDLNLILLNDPNGECFGIDHNQTGRPSPFGTLRRNLEEEERAKQSGIASGQKCASLRATCLVLENLDVFLATLGHRAYFLDLQQLLST
jgi:hypothetical protein